MSKKRITVLLTAAMDGTLLAMEVVNQYLHPRAFSSIKQDLKSLPPCISWSASKKGWMTSDIFHTFLVKVNENFRVSNRNCILFLDNFSGHKASVNRCSINDLSNIRIEYLPANCTSICQPIDMGIGQAFKLRYRKFLHEHMCNQMFADRPPTTGLDLLRVCVWLSKAWNSLNGTQTVRRCFAKAGFIMPDEELMSTGKPLKIQGPMKETSWLLRLRSLIPLWWKTMNKFSTKCWCPLRPAMSPSLMRKMGS